MAAFTPDFVRESSDSLESREREYVSARAVRDRRLVLFQKVGFGAIAYYVYYTVANGALQSAAAHATCLLCILGSWIALKKFAQSVIASWLFLLGLNTSLAISALFDHTIDSPALWTVSLLPMISACILNARATTICTVVAGLEIVAMALVGEMGWVEPEIDLSDGDRVMVLVLSLGTHSLIAYVLSIYLVSQLRFVANRRRLIESAHEAETKANEAKTEFLARMSREIRTPMNGLLGMMEFLRARESMQSQREAIDTVQRCGSNLLSLLDDILDISNVETGHFELRCAPVDVVILVQDVHQLFLAQAKTLGVELRIELQFESYWCMADETRLRQVISNLLGNALKFSEGKPVGIRVFAREQEKEEDSLLCIEIQDQGIGMSPSQQRRVFEQYEQVETQFTSGKGGTGLGLSISNRLVQEMGGCIELSSEVGQGSTFRVVAPFQTCLVPEDAPHEDSKLQRSEPGVSLHVLVVEDDEIHRKVATMALERLACSVRLAENGVDALKRASVERFDLVFMDLKMPKMNGLDATRRIKRSRGLNSNTPIIALTASAFPREIQECLEAGMAAHLAKPIHMVELAKVVAHYGGSPCGELKRCA